MRKKNDFNKPADTIIGQGFTIQAARLTGSESIRVDGTLIGDITLDGALLLSDTGRIEGNIQVSSALIAGNIVGNITCQASLHITATACIRGDITTEALIVDKGAVLQGYCRSGTPAAEA